MPFSFGEVGTALLGLLAASRVMSTASAFAVLSVIRHLLGAAKLGLVTDLARLQDALVGRLEAQNDEHRANAAKTRAEAAALNATAAKTLREAAAIANTHGATQEPADTPEARMTAWREAEGQLHDAITRLRLHGGDLAIDSAELTRLLPPAERAP